MRVGALSTPTRFVVVMGLASAAGLGAGATVAQGVSNASIVEYLRNRDDLGRRTRGAWVRAARRRFGGAALDRGGAGRPEIEVAKQVLASALFIGVEPKVGVESAWRGWRAALQGVPPPIARLYPQLEQEGRKPDGRPIDLALAFADHYVDEIAPDLVVWWMMALEAGTLSDAALVETRAGLDATRVKMRPLLLDKLRLLARLDRQRKAAAVDEAWRRELEDEARAVEQELRRAFVWVGRRPEVLDPTRTPYDRLMLALDDFELRPSREDRFLDPKAPPPPARPVPNRAAPRSAPRAGASGPALVEPIAPPPIVDLPPQPRAGTATAFRDPVAGRPSFQLARAYRSRLTRTLEVWMGTPYRWGLDRAGVGTDCSGFTRGVLAEAFDLELPRTSRDQARSGRPVARPALRAGDLVVFDTNEDGLVNHVGLFVGEGQVAHASVARGVITEPLSAPHLRRSYRGARRLLAFGP